MQNVLHTGALGHHHRLHISLVLGSQHLISICREYGVVVIHEMEVHTHAINIRLCLKGKHEGITFDLCQQRRKVIGKCSIILTAFLDALILGVQQKVTTTANA